MNNSSENSALDGSSLNDFEVWILNTFRYNPDTGKVHRIFKNGDLREVGLSKVDGYFQICARRKLIYAHRLAFFLMLNRWPDQQLDHINHDRSDNRWSNLRECSSSENAQNRSLSSRNTSGFKGITLCKRSNRWQAEVIRDGVRHKKSFVFENLSDAVAWVDAKRAELHGAFLHSGVSDLYTKGESNE